MVHDFGLNQLIKPPTRVTNNSSSIIDHIYSTDEQANYEILVPKIAISDHYPIALTYHNHIKTCRENNYKTIFYHSFSGLNMELLLNDLAKTNFEVIETIHNPNEVLKYFSAIMNGILTKHVPFKEKRAKRLKQPGWYNEEIKNAILLRNKFQYAGNWPMYKVWRNEVNSIIRISKKNYFNKAIKDKSDTKFLWQNLRNITTSDDNEHRVPNKLLINNSEIEGAQNVVNALNNHFVNICYINNKTSVNSKYINDLKIYLDRKLSNRHFEVKFISPLEVKNMIDKLDSSKSIGNDGIAPKILKMCKDFISQPIASIINSCISMSIFPSEFKKACVTPLFKGGDKNDPNNYRPISILPTLSKVFERHIANQLKHYLKHTNILFSNQSGFREDHSCQTALIRLADSWLIELD